MLNSFSEKLTIIMKVVFHILSKYSNPYTVRNPAASIDNTSEKRLIKNPCARCFKEVSLSTTGCMEIKHVKFLRQISTTMRSVTSKDGEFL